MDTTALSSEDLKALDSVRTQLYNLTRSIQTLNRGIRSTHPLPPWPSIHTSTQMLAQATHDLITNLSNHAEIFNKVVVYPSTNYPGRTQEDILGQLLRKKLEPPVEKLVEEGLSIEASKYHDEGVCDRSRTWLLERIGEYIQTEMEDNFTADERARGLDTVNTGLRRKLDPRRPSDDDDDDEDEESDDEDDEKMEDVQVPLSVTSVNVTTDGPVEFGMGQVATNPTGTVRTEEDILRFATSGATVRPAGPPIRK
ncbi:hypothetical protein HYFRA_00010899 [Hymenoscyphus fraxineus]|uniref:Mediator of RNA polymerase II transcription subunit 8 n=1 Tax=Hymenoscyphus fraxineus TaxID=746836 RepID=A0A9N9KWK0_9HELO|nr:hypothetical protein HYFRA_00010899 [Hymenoscyphus fraxineus]